MRFYSKKAGHKVTVFQADMTVQQIHGLSVPKRVNWGVLSFTPLRLGSREFDSPIPGRERERGPGFLAMRGIAGGRVTGVLTSEEGAEQLRRAGHTIRDDKGRDITEKSVIEFLLNHSRYGLDFVSIDNEEAQQMLDDLGLIEIDDGQVWCEFCEKPFKNWGDARKHAVKNEEHQISLASAKAQKYQIPASESSAPIVT